MILVIVVGEVFIYHQHYNTTGVSFINILYVPFLYERTLPSFTLVTVWPLKSLVFIRIPDQKLFVKC